MKSLQHQIQSADPEYDWVHIASRSHTARATDDELQVSRVADDLPPFFEVASDAWEEPDAFEISENAIETVSTEAGTQ